MSDRPTPETDAAEYLISIGRKNDQWVVRSDVSRQLERERDKAREQLNWLNHLIETIRDKADLRFAGNSGFLAFSDIKSAARRSLEIGGTK